MKPRYLIAVDLDGTLLDDQKQISQETVEYFKQLSNDGHIIVLASGRPVRTMVDYYNLLELKTPMVTYNGAHISGQNSQGFEEFSFKFPKEHIFEIISEMEGAITNIMMETLDVVWLDKPEPNLEIFYASKHVDIIYGDVFKNLTEDPLTLIVNLKDDSDETKLKVLQSVRNFPEYEIRFWHSSSYAELYKKNMTKRDGIKQIAAYYGIDPKYTVAIGDAENDIQMLDWAEIGIAMINGNESAKRHSDLISVASNNDDGVMKTLKTIIK